MVDTYAYVVEDEFGSFHNYFFEKEDADKYVAAAERCNKNIHFFTRYKKITDEMKKRKSPNQYTFDDLLHMEDQ